MNEKIRALAGQSGFDVTHHKWIFCNDNVGEGECHELLEKFAELIVRECADACDELAEKLSEQRPNSNYDAVAYECAEHIKTHFGFET